MKAVKKFQGASVYEALQKVKSELGPDALILESKQTTQKRFGCIPSSQVWEVLAASDGQPRESQSGNISPFGGPTPAVNATTVTTEEWEVIKRALADLQWEVRKLSRQGQLDRVISFAPSLRSLYHQLREQEVDEELIFEVVTNVSDELSAQALNNYGLVADCAARHLGRLVACGGTLNAVEGGAKAVFIVGPTGVGKTTTIAKLAARSALIAKRRVVLISIDNYRIAALPQLRTYADIMGLTMEVAQSPTQLRQMVERHQDKDLILIDTPGRGQRNEQQIADLKAFVEAVPHRAVHLAVAASIRHRELVDIVTRFGAIDFDSLLVTKLDEALVYGPVLNIVNRFHKPLSYLTTGQSVPEDLEDATAARIANLLLGKGL